MLTEHLPEVLNYFRHRITNAVSEGLNSKIQSIKSMARGFRGFANYRIRIHSSVESSTWLFPPLPIKNPESFSNQSAIKALNPNLLVTGVGIAPVIAVSIKARA